MKKCLLVIMCLLLLCVGALAEEADYEYRALPDGTVEITKYTGSGTDITVPDTLGGGKVTAIGEGAFMNNTTMRFAKLPEGVKTIGDSAFYGCGSLEYMQLPETLEEVGYSAFAYCGALFHVALPDSLTYLGERAFAFCSGLESAYVPNNLEAVGEGTFEECTALRDVYLGANIKTLGANAFTGCSALERVDLPYGITSVGMQAFAGCRSLKAAYLPKTVETMGVEMFQGCPDVVVRVVPDSHAHKYMTQLGLPVRLAMREGDWGYDLLPDGTAELTISYKREGEITVPSRVNGHPVYTVTEAALRSVKSTRVTIEEGITAIADHAFHGCETLTAVVLPRSLTAIGEYAFAGCVNLKEINRPAGLTHVAATAFEGAGCDLNAGFSQQAQVTPGEVNITPPQSGNPFAGMMDVFAAVKENVPAPTAAPTAKVPKEPPYTCIMTADDTLKITRFWQHIDPSAHVVVPDTLNGVPVTRVGKEVFADMKGITRVTLPEGIVQIENNAFRNCADLEQVDLPQSLKIIGDGIFEGCPKLTYVTLPDNIRQIGEDIFGGQNTTVAVKEGTAAWQRMAEEGMNVVEPGSAPAAPAPAAPVPTQAPAPAAPAPTQAPAPVSAPAASEYETMPAGDGTLRVMRYTGKGGKVVVPAQINGQAVSYVHAAFANRGDITEVVIPEGVNALGPMVFMNCTGLTQVTLPQSLREIGQEAFSGCTALKSLSLPDEIYLFGRDVFKGCASLAVNLNPGTRTYTTLQREGLVQ